MDHEQQEIVRHAVIGGIVAIALASFHEIADKVAKEWLAGHANLATAVEWVALFLVVFSAILLIEFYVRIRQWKATIRLDDVGSVDGRWIEAILLDGHIKGVSTLEISSAAGEGFRIRGFTHNIGPGGSVDLKSTGTFNSTHGKLFGNNGIAYVFEGRTPLGKEHFGVGYMRFLQPGGTSAVQLEGAFFARTENRLVHVIGIKLNEGSPNALTSEEVVAIMRDYVARPATIAAAASHREEASAKPYD